MYDTNVTIVGNALNAPELRRTSSTNALVANFRVASTSRRYDRDTGRWVDGPSLRVRVTCWRRLAEGVTRSVVTGDPLMVTGRMYTRDWVGDDGQHRVSYELEAVAVGHDLSRGFSQFVRHRTAGVTSAVEDAETDARIAGEASTAVPASVPASVPAPWMTRAPGTPSARPERTRRHEDADGYPTPNGVAAPAFEPSPSDDEYGEFVSVEASTDAQATGGAGGVGDNPRAGDMGGAEVIGSTDGAAPVTAAGGDPVVGGDEDSADADDEDAEDRDTDGGHVEDALAAVRAAGLTDEVSALGRRGRRGRAPRVPVPAPV
jgi:single-strand DNA-binding protein